MNKRTSYIFILVVLIALVSLSGAASAAAGDVIPSDKVNELQLSLEEYYYLHLNEWTLEPIDLAEGYSYQDAEAEYEINGQRYTVQQYSPDRLVVEPKGGNFYAINPEDLVGYEVQDDMILRRADDGSDVRYCVQHLISSQNPEDKLLVVTLADGVTGYRKYSVSGCSEMNFATVAYCYLNEIDTTVSHLNRINKMGVKYNDFFLHHKNEAISVVYRV